VAARLLYHFFFLENGMENLQQQIPTQQQNMKPAKNNISD
jgi:hypothetical protein